MPNTLSEEREIRLYELCNDKLQLQTDFDEAHQQIFQILKHHLADEIALAVKEAEERTKNDETMLAKSNVL